MKSIWNGSISFGLVSIAIDLYSAVQEHVLGFKVLCQKCSTPVSYKRWCQHCKKEINWDNTVKGLEIQKGKYIVLTQEVIKKLRPEKTNSIDIVEFVDVSAIAPIYYRSHYYAAPGKHAQKAYALLQESLKSMGKAAIGTFVMRDKKYVCALQWYDAGILISTLHYDYEIRAMSKVRQLTSKQAKFNATELTLAKQLIRSLGKKKFNIAQFKDTFAQELKKLLKKHAQGKMSKVNAKKAKTNQSSPTLIKQLQESLESAHA